ncbi:MAG: MoaD/ThiS family protein [Anaerolineaceae bacterium]|nr:MoaD/ThiS family protein [Anaerolineaceae bacterium]
MRVKVQAIGDLREYFGRDPVEVALPDGATVRDLLDTLDMRLGARLPGYLWDRETRRFKGPVLLVVEKKAVQDESASLADGIEVRIMRAIAGG